jgi:hypothetical protein
VNTEPGTLDRLGGGGGGEAASVVNGFDGDVFRVIGRLVWGATEQQVILEHNHRQKGFGIRKGLGSRVEGLGFGEIRTIVERKVVGFTVDDCS